MPKTVSDLWSEYDDLSTIIRDVGGDIAGNAILDRSNTVAAMLLQTNDLIQRLQGRGDSPWNMKNWIVCGAD